MNRKQLFFGFLTAFSFLVFFGGVTFAKFTTTATATHNVFSTAANFPATSSAHLVINEVYYLVDSAHGLDSPKDRGATGSGTSHDVNVDISGNGEGSSNSVDVNNSSNCTIIQSNDTTIINNVNSSASTGGNSGDGNITTGDASSTVIINNGGSSNSSSGCGGGGSDSRNDEWVELYNPTDSEINLKNWTLTDNSGHETKISGTKKIKAKGFAVLAKSSSSFAKWSIPSDVLKIDLGKEFGDGLDNSGDHLVLKDANGTEVDRMSWESGQIPPAPLGSSLERISAGLDTDSISDWHSQNPPKPGS